MKPTDGLISQIYFVKKLYMFRAVPLPITRSLPLYIRQWYMSCKFDDIHQCRMYSERLLMMGRGTARNIKINLYNVYLLPSNTISPIKRPGYRKSLYYVSSDNMFRPSSVHHQAYTELVM